MTKYVIIATFKIDELYHDDVIYCKDLEHAFSFAEVLIEMISITLLRIEIDKESSL